MVLLSSGVLFGERFCGRSDGRVRDGASVASARKRRGQRDARSRASRAMTRTVSSPAMVPSTAGRTEWSIADARNCAAPGGVRSTTRLPDASAVTSSSAHSRASRAASISSSGPAAGVRSRRPRRGPRRRARRTGVRIFTARSSTRSRDSVACVTRHALRGEQLGELLLRVDRAAGQQRRDQRVPGRLGVRGRRVTLISPLQQPGQQRLLRVQAVLGLVPDDRLRAVDAPRR